MDVMRETDKNQVRQHYEVMKEMGDCYTSNGDYEKAKRCYEKASTLGPDEAGPYIGLGVIAFQNELLDDAEIAFRVACRLNKNCAEGWSGLAMVEQKRDNCQKAFEYYLKCLELDTDNLTALLGLFQASSRMGSFEKVIHYLQVYLDMHPADTSVMFTLAALYMKDARLKESKRMLLNLLALEPDNKDAANLLEEVEHNMAGANLAGATL
ncbi:MAG: tetratricopeptide repeat protein [Phycisphaerae bacterium]|jgi:tetratricopeptide (TPR) repeat protein